MQHAQRYKARPVLQIGRSPFFRFCLNSSMGMAGLKPYGLIPAFRNQRPCTRRWTLYLSAKPRRPKSRFRISLSLSRWEIGVAKRLFARASRGLLLSSGSMVFLAMSRERETKRVRKPLLSSPGSKLLCRFRSQSLMKSVSIDTSCT